MRFFFALLGFLLFSSLSAESLAPSVRVCAEAGYVPFDMRNSQGEWYGFSPDLMQAFANYSKRPIAFIDVDWNGVIPALLTGKCDMITPAMGVTPARARTVAFSLPTYVNHVVLVRALPLSAKENIILNTDWKKEKFDNKSVLIGSKQGSSADTFASSYFKEASLMRYVSAVDLMNALLTHKVEAIVYDEPFVRQFAQTHSVKLEIYRTGKSENLGAAFRPQDKALLKEFNDFLREYQASGAYEKLLKRYFP